MKKYIYHIAFFLNICAIVFTAKRFVIHFLPGWIAITIGIICGVGLVYGFYACFNPKEKNNIKWFHILPHFLIIPMQIITGWHVMEEVGGIGAGIFGVIWFGLLFTLIIPVFLFELFELWFFIKRQSKLNTFDKFNIFWLLSQIIFITCIIPTPFSLVGHNFLIGP